MKLYIISMVTVLCLLILGGCQKTYQGEYVQWGEGNTGTEKLEENSIPYKIEEDQVYIPEDALDDAVSCCS
ncbi:hypothetical protein GJU40_13325 [Bacillus lacus]|uniref:Lipoprotein n=1 Tax=Metabacillus lacus TaxID=1983721 RepID=A0A7X2J0Q4_9BACI|nr:hypothetical protein [Metabacillus lacus]MRX73124.1 hypothetical protein [Metabacillus lacus]